MKKLIFSLFICLLINASSAQKILFVNDNDDIVANSDTLINSLGRSKYKTFDHYNIADSAGIIPSAALMIKYDVVIWYSSTDGVGLRFWKDSSAINPNIKAFVDAGKSLWIIGQDVLYDAYGKAPLAFKPGDFTHDYMGILAYENQSKSDDGDLGVAQLDRSASAPTNFATKLDWIFSTLWYVDGCTLRNGVESIYKMGPSGYILAGYDAMFYSKLQNKKVMSTLFDPALIKTPAQRVAFLNASLDYLLLMAKVRELSISNLKIVPNPSNQIAVMFGDFQQGDEIFVYNALGAMVKSKHIDNKVKNHSLNVQDLATGQYFIQVMRNASAIYAGKLTVQL